MPNLIERLAPDRELSDVKRQPPNTAVSFQSSGPISRGFRIGWSGLALLAVASALSPLEVMAHNAFSIGHPERLLALAALVWVGAVAVAAFLVRRGVRRTTAVYTTFILTLILFRGGSVLTSFGPGSGWIVLGSLAVLTIALIARLEAHEVLGWGIVSIAVGLASGPVIAFIQGTVEIGESRVVDSPSVPLGLASHPDIFLVVVDGYAGLKTLDRDFGIARPGVRDALESRGYEIPESAWSSYPTTLSSLPSLLEMAYPLLPGEGISPATELDLSEVIGGSNELNDLLTSEGYETVMIESAWSDSICGDEIDRCIPSPLMDEAMFMALEKSVVGPSMLQSFGYSFTVGSQHTMRWLLENSQGLSRDDRPTFVFAHVMAPHAPFFLRGDCRTMFSEAASGVAFARPADDLNLRRDAYLEQAACVDAFIVELSDLIDPEDVVVVTGDHGTDQRSQLQRHPSTWNAEDLVERFNIFLAVRTGTDCPIGDSIVLPNLFRRVLSCLGNPSIADLEARMLKHASVTIGGEPSPIMEVEKSDVEVLLGSA